MDNIDTIDALRSSEAQYRRLFETAQDGILILDAHTGLITDVNPFLIRLLDYSRKDFIGRALWDIGAFKQIKESKAAFRKLQGNKYIRYEDLPLETRSGRRVNVEFVSNVYDANGKGVIQCNIRDITERKKAQNTLREYERVVDGLDEMIMVVDRQYRYVIANRAFLNFRGMPPDQVIGHFVNEVVGTEVFLTQVKGKMDECFQGKSVRYNMTYDFPGKGKRELLVCYFPIDAPAATERIACVLQDVTELKLAEEALRTSEQRFSKAFRSNPLGLTISTEKGGRYLDVNDAFLELVGFKRKDVIGRTSAGIRFWSEPRDRQEVLRCLEEEGNVAMHRTRYRTAKGEIREAEMWVEAIELDGQRCLLGITRDITEVQQLEAQFRQAQKMEAIGRLAGGIAHDFNNILGVIVGYSDLSEGLIPPDNPVSRYVSEIKKAAQRAEVLTRQLLAFSRKQIVFPKVLNLNDVVSNATSMFLRLVGEDIKIEFRPSRPLGNIEADPSQIEQILMNLVVNARDAMPTGGSIIVETGETDLDEDYVSRHPGSRAGHNVILMVSDTGCGMDDNIKSQLFEPFFTTKPAGQGTGLGLSTVYGIVKQSSGYIVVYSETGKGTTFKIYFPRVAGKAEELASPREEIEPPRGSETILVVEDDETLREITVKLLQDAGYQVVNAGNAEAALSMLAASGRDIDLVLTDVVMPGTSGPALVIQAKKSHPKLCSLFMSGYASDLVGRQGVVLQEGSLLEKPFTRKSLLTKIHVALHSETATL
jgi:PAS domain S-box-containing protein